MDNKVKITIIVLVAVFLIYIFYVKNRSTSTEMFSPVDTSMETNALPYNSYEIDDMRDDESAYYDKRFITKNTNTGPNYKKSNYAEGARGNIGNDDWKQFFDSNNNLIGGSQVSNTNVDGVDETIPFDASGSSSNATFTEKTKATCGSNQDCSVEELFNPEYYLPQEQNDEWWETLDQSIPVKDRHLVNINKPIGINSIGSSLRNASYDIRGTPACPKFAISPFMNSSIDPDTNIKAWNY